MPVINGFFSVWNLAYISVPTPMTSQDNRISWSSPSIAIVKSIEFKQVSTMSVADGVSKGSPYGHLWKTDDTSWQTDIAMPFLVPAHSMYVDPSGQVTNGNLPLCANLPVENISGFLSSVVSARFIWRALASIWGHDQSSFSSFRTRDWGGGFDGVIQKCSISVDGESSMLNISIISSDDPRPHFYMTTVLPQYNTISTLRLARAWDFSIPSDIEVLGSPNARYVPVENDVPNRMVNASATLDGLPMLAPYWGPSMTEDGRYVAVRSFNLNVESSIDRIPSVGIGSSKPIFVIRNTKCSGSVDVIPYVVWTNGNEKAISLSLPDISSPNKPPEGWVVDSQSLEEISRYGGQFFVTGRPDYKGNAKPLYFEIGMRDGTPPVPSEPKYIIVNREVLGPINVAVLSMRPNVGDTNVLHIEFNTSPNVDLSTHNPFDNSRHGTMFPPV